MHKKVNLLIVYTNRRVSKAKQNYSTFSRIITFYDKNINGNKNYALHYSETSYKYALALRRVLVNDKWRRFAPPDKHTPLQNNKDRRKARAKRSFVLNRLRNLPLFRSLVFFLDIALFFLLQCLA